MNGFDDLLFLLSQTCLFFCNVVNKDKKTRSIEAEKTNFRVWQ
jgi:hypothetical protein